MSEAVGTRVAGNIRAEMARQGKRQGPMAERLGMTQQALSRRLCGETSIDVDELHAIAAYLELPVSTLLRDETGAVSA